MDRATTDAAVEPSAASGHPRPLLGVRLVAAARDQAAVTTAVSAGLFVAQVEVGRRFGQGGLGEYTLTSLAIYLTTTIAMLAVPVTVGREVAYLHEHEREDERVADAGLALVLMLATVGGTALTLLWGLIEPPSRPGPLPPFLVGVAVVCSCLIGYSSQVLQARLSIAAAGLVLIAQPLAVMIAFAVGTFRPVVGPGQLVVAGFLGGGIAGAVALALVGIRPRFDITAAKRLLRSAVGLAPITYGNVLSTWADRLVVLAVLGPASLGVYQAASALVEGALRLLRSGGSFFIAAFGRAVARGPEQAGQLRLVLVRLWAAYAVVIAGGLIAGGDGLVRFLYSAVFADAATPLRILALGLVPSVVSITLLTAGAGLAHTDPLVIARAAIPAQIAAGIAGAVLGGVTGAATAQVLLITVVAIAQLRWSRDPELAIGARLGRRIALLAVLAPVVSLLIRSAPFDWPERLALGAVASGLLSFALVLGAQERWVLRRLVTRTPPAR